MLASTPPYTGPYTGAPALVRAAAAIAQKAPCPASDIAPLLVLTDPGRLPDPMLLASHLPPGCGIIYRHFGHKDAAQIATTAQAICTARGLSFFVSYDLKLNLRPDTGVHFPERFRSFITDYRKAHPKRLITAAAHDSESAIAACNRGADAVLLSCVFDSPCANASTALGAEQFAQMTQAIDGPVYALGGITAQNAKTLHGSAAGLAVVGGVFDA